MDTVRRWPVAQAARVVHAGGIIAYPTEAVYGLGCDPTDGPAVMRLLEIKRRPVELGLILIGADIAQLRPYFGELDRAALARVTRSWPGPVTWLLPTTAGTPAWLRGRHDTIALRVTDHPLASALCRELGHALVSTSANRHHQPPARTALLVRKRLGIDVDLVLAGSVGPLRRPTEIRDARTGRIVRPA
jgi:L-threonylcarbamoyladenylate synthase